MEDNVPARKVLLSQRLGLPAYHDLGRFCCMALSLMEKATRPLKIHPCGVPRS